MSKGFNFPNMPEDWPPTIDFLIMEDGQATKYYLFVNSDGLVGSTAHYMDSWNVDCPKETQTIKKGKIAYEIR